MGRYLPSLLKREAEQIMDELRKEPSEMAAKRHCII